MVRLEEGEPEAKVEERPEVAVAVATGEVVATGEAETAAEAKEEASPLTVNSHWCVKRNKQIWSS